MSGNNYNTWHVMCYHVSVAGVDIGSFVFFCSRRSSSRELFFKAFEKMETSVKPAGWKFGWKRKAGERLTAAASEQFSQKNEAEYPDECDDLMKVISKRTCISLEDGIAKSARLMSEGITLAEAGRSWEAVKKWDEALTLAPENETLHEMKAQVFMDLHEVVQAVQSAQRAVALKPTWWVAYQTLGRAYLSVGEVQLAKQSFIRSIFLNPAEPELWEEDLKWTLSLISRKREMDLSFESKITEKATILDEEIHEAADCKVDSESLVEQNCLDLYTSSNEWKQCPNMNRVPHNYVLMR